MTVLKTHRKTGGHNHKSYTSNLCQAISPVFSSSDWSFCSISARAFSLFSSFCKRLPTSTIAPLYTMSPMFSSGPLDSCFIAGDGSSSRFPTAGSKMQHKRTLPEHTTLRKRKQLTLPHLSQEFHWFFTYSNMTSPHQHKRKVYCATFPRNFR